MAEGHEVARAVVTIIPSLAGAQKTITKELTGASEPAAQEAGSKSGAVFLHSLSMSSWSAALIRCLRIPAHRCRNTLRMRFRLPGCLRMNTCPP